MTPFRRERPGLCCRLRLPLRTPGSPGAQAGRPGSRHVGAYVRFSLSSGGLRKIVWSLGLLCVVWVYNVLCSASTDECFSERFPTSLGLAKFFYWGMMGYAEALVLNRLALVIPQNMQERRK